MNNDDEQQATITSDAELARFLANEELIAAGQHYDSEDDNDLLGINADSGSDEDYGKSRKKKKKRPKKSPSKQQKPDPVKKSFKRKKSAKSSVETNKIVPHDGANGTTSNSLATATASDDADSSVLIENCDKKEGTVGSAGGSNEPAPKKRKKKNPVNEKDENGFNTGPWSKEEEEAFAQGLELFGRDFLSVEKFVGTRSKASIGSHIQKHFLDLYFRKEELPERVLDSGLGHTRSGRPLDPLSASAIRYVFSKPERVELGCDGPVQNWDESKKKQRDAAAKLKNKWFVDKYAAEHAELAAEARGEAEPGSSAATRRKIRKLVTLEEANQASAEAKLKLPARPSAPAPVKTTTTTTTTTAVADNGKREESTDDNKENASATTTTTPVTAAAAAAAAPSVGQDITVANEEKSVQLPTTRLEEVEEEHGKNNTDQPQKKSVKKSAIPKTSHHSVKKQRDRMLQLEQSFDFTKSYREFESSQRLYENYIDGMERSSQSLSVFGAQYATLGELTMIACDPPRAPNQRSRTRGAFEQPFTVTIHTNALLMMDIHCHWTNHEVIGLLAGRVTSDEPGLQPNAGIGCEQSSAVGGDVTETGVVDKKKLKMDVVAAFPVNAVGDEEQQVNDAVAGAVLEQEADDRHQNVEMDVVDSVAVKEQIEAAGLQVVGWYHSHPRFQPDPSVKDCVNQYEQQRFHQSDQARQAFLGMIVATNDTRLPNDWSIVNSFITRPPSSSRPAVDGKYDVSQVPLPSFVPPVLVRDASVDPATRDRLQALDRAYRSNPSRIPMSSVWRPRLAWQLLDDQLSAQAQQAQVEQSETTARGSTGASTVQETAAIVVVAPESVTRADVLTFPESMDQEDDGEQTGGAESSTEEESSAKKRRRATLLSALPVNVSSNAGETIVEQQQEETKKEVSSDRNSAAVTTFRAKLSNSIKRWISHLPDSDRKWISEFINNLP